MSAEYETDPIKVAAMTAKHYQARIADLEAIIEGLNQTVIGTLQKRDGARKELIAARAERNALVAALKYLLAAWDDYELDGKGAKERARDAIKAAGAKP